MFGFLANLASKFIPAITGLASRAIPAVTRAVAVGKKIVPRVIGAVGKAQNALHTAKNIGKTARGIVGNISPELGKKIDETYNKKMIGGKSLGDLVESSDRGLGQVKDVADKAKAVLANIPTE
jgi:hypothetical protein